VPEKGCRGRRVTSIDVIVGKKLKRFTINSVIPELFSIREVKFVLKSTVVILHAQERTRDELPFFPSSP